MSKYGLKIATLHAESLSAFQNAEEATRHFDAIRDDALAELIELSKLSGNKFVADFSPESLMSLETWYFDHYETNTFHTLHIDQQAFESYMGIYLLAVIAKSSAGAQWVVAESPFAKGKYELGVKKGLLTKMLSNCKDYYRTPNNKRRQSLYREYIKYFG